MVQALKLFQLFFMLKRAERKKKMSNCPICGKEIYSWMRICDNCSLKYALCDFTGRWVLKSEATEISNYRFIANDVFKKAMESGKYWNCEDCGQIRRYGDRDYITYDGTRICKDCYYDRYNTCHRCSQVFLATDMTYDDYEDNYYCADCDKRRYKKVIKEYGYKPRPKFKTKAHDEFETDSSIKELLFGVELEIDKGENPENCAADICEYNSNVYCKHDGSLIEGLEIVTHPCTLDYHKDELGWEGITQTALDYDFESHYANTCGLHIHVGRNQLGDFDEETIKETIAKVIILVNRHWDNMVKFSRREEEQLDEWATRPNLNLRYTPKKDVIKRALETEHNGRYQAVNLQNRSTIEFRLYRGTLRTESILAALELTSNICKYAMANDLDAVLSSQWDDIIDIEYHKELDDYLSKMKIYGYEMKQTKIREIPEALATPVENVEDLKVGDRVIVMRAIGWEKTATNDYLLYNEAEVVKITDAPPIMNNVLLNFHEELGCTHSDGGNYRKNTYYWLRHEALDYID